MVRTRTALHTGSIGLTGFTNYWGPILSWINSLNEPLKGALDFVIQRKLSMNYSRISCAIDIFFLHLKDTQTYTEQELVALLKKHVQEAFRYLYHHYASALNGIILSIVPDPEIAGDILQEVFVKIWRQIGQYDPAKGRLFTWMLTIARSTAIDTLRSKDWQNRKRSAALTEDYTLLPDKTAQLADLYELRKSLAGLKDDHKVLVELSYFQGYTQEEIAKILRIPVGTVKTRLRAALLQLRQQINL